MRRTWAAPFLFCSLVAVNAARADPIADALSQASDAEANAGSAATKLSDAAAGVARQRDALSGIVNRLEEERRKRLLLTPLIGGAITQTQTHIASTRAEIATLQAARDAAIKAAADADSDRRRAHDAIGDTIERERTAFQTSPGYVAADKAVTSRSAALDMTRIDIQARSESEPAIVAAQQRVDEALARLEALRNAIEPDEKSIAAASVKWMDAKNEWSRARQTFEQEQTSLVDATAALREAQRTLAALTATFEAGLEQRDAVIAARADWKAATEIAKQRQRESVAAGQRVTDAQAALAQMDADLIALQAMKDEGDKTLEALQLEAMSIRTALASACQALSAAETDVLGARQAARNAMSAIRSIPEPAPAK